MFSERLLDHFEHPRNVGALEPPATTVQAENPVCGDILRLSARFENGRATDVRYQVRGCTAAIGVGSALTELLAGKSLDEMRALDKAAIEASVGGLPNESKHTAQLALDGLQALIKAASSER